MQWASLHLKVTIAGRGIAALMCIWCGFSAAQTRPLNDTGITFSGWAVNVNSASCLASDPAGQDCRYGRDAAALAGTLNKVGSSGGIDGFDFTKVCNSGELAGQGTCPANPTTVGAGGDEWGCTRDNVTGLLWEVKTTSGLRSMNHRYTWYLSSSPDGNNGVASGGSCATTGRCDTEKYVSDVNAAGLCGAFIGWRLPTVKELDSIVDFGRSNPAIDLTRFPNTPLSGVWSGSPLAGNSSSSWGVNLPYGDARYGYRSLALSVRLVRGGQ
jgi:Protein of unknown function (DUF1566)